MKLRVLAASCAAALALAVAGCGGDNGDSVPASEESCFQAVDHIYDRLLSADTFGELVKETAEITGGAQTSRVEDLIPECKDLSDDEKASLERKLRDKADRVEAHVEDLMSE